MTHIHIAATRFGFVPGGHDGFLYRALHLEAREVALFCYLLFDSTTDEYVSECQTWNRCTASPFTL